MSLPLALPKRWVCSDLLPLVNWGRRRLLEPLVLGDGADWIKTQAAEHFPDAVKVLDWPHLWRKIQAAVRALQPGQRLARRAWRKAH